MHAHTVYNIIQCTPFTLSLGNDFDFDFLRLTTIVHMLDAIIRITMITNSVANPMIIPMITGHGDSRRLAGDISMSRD